MDLLINQLQEHQILSSYNFARNADVVFSESLTKKQYENLELPEHNIIFENEYYVIYKISSFELKENDVIYCNNYFYKDLFELLSKVKIFKNIKVITGQTDKNITKKDFKLKPACVSEWYATNVNYSDESLISIPIGLANDHPKNLNFKNFNSLKKNDEKKEKVYLNFEVNTNFFTRNRVIKKLNGLNWVENETQKLELNDYVKKLNSYKYILCPEGNGIDTHRVWESIYAGTTPVVKKNIFYKQFKNLPIVMVDALDKTNFNQIEKQYHKLNTSDEEKLSINWWVDKIKSSNIKNDTNSITLTESLNDHKLNMKRFKKMLIREQKLKRNKTVLRKIYLKLVRF